MEVEGRASDGGSDSEADGVREIGVKDVDKADYKYD